MWQITPACMCKVWHMLLWPSSYACRQQYRPGMVNQMLQNSTTCKFTFNNLYSCSTRYIYHQHFIFAFNNKKRETGKKRLVMTNDNVFYFENCNIRWHASRENSRVRSQMFIAEACSCNKSSRPAAATPSTVSVTSPPVPSSRANFIS